MQRPRLRGRLHSGPRENWEAVKDRYGRIAGWRAYRAVGDVGD
jgi:hypothetical protein